MQCPLSFLSLRFQSLTLPLWGKQPHLFPFQSCRFWISILGLLSVFTETLQRGNCTTWLHVQCPKHRSKVRSTFTCAIMNRHPLSCSKICSYVMLLANKWMLKKTGEDTESILFNLGVFLFFFLQAEGYVKKTHYYRLTTSIFFSLRTTFQFVQLKGWSLKVIPQVVHGILLCFALTTQHNSYC